jgi:rhodanese-related sulfurtransferase
MSKTLSDFIQEARANLQEIQADDLAERIEDGEDLLLVDVREPYEYEQTHIPDSLLIPRGMLEGAADPNNKHRVETLYSARGRELVLVCDTGARSAMACTTLNLMGFDQVLNLAGGIKMWEAEDLPLESGPYEGPLP